MTENHPLKIAMVAACPFPTSQGSQVLIRELSEALVRRRHQVHVITYHFGEDQPCPGLIIHRIPEIFRYNKFRSGPEIRKPILDLLLMRQLDQVVRREKIDVIHAHNYEAPLASFPVRFLRQVPVVYHSHNTMSDEFYTYFRLKIPQVLARGAAHLMDRFIPRHADFVIAINRQVAAFLTEMGVSTTKMKYLPPGIDYGEPIAHPDAALRERLGFGSGPLLVYAGNLDGYQRLDLLWEALPIVFNDHPDARMVILTSSDCHSLEAELKRRNLQQKVIRVQHSSFDQVKQILALSHLAVNPRIAWSGFPIKLLNYMAAGLPVIAFRGAATPVLDGVSGLLIESGNAKHFGMACSALLDDARLAQRMGQAGQQIVQRDYNWDSISAKIERIYYQLLGHSIAERASLHPEFTPVLAE